MRHDTRDRSPDQSGRFLEGYLLETLAAATVDANGELQPALARFAVFDCHAQYDGTGDRHDVASYAFNWQRVGQAVVANLHEDTDGSLGVYVLAEKRGDVLVARTIGCEATDLDIGGIV